MLGGELEISCLLLPSLPGRARVDGHIAERRGDAIHLGAPRLLKAGDNLVVGVEASGAA